jgi:hypothetical protein
LLKMNAREFLDLQGAYQGVYLELDEATAMAKRGLDEPAIRSAIAKSTGGGSFADKATALADRQTYGDKKKKADRENLARKQRGDFRKTTSSSPGLHGYANKVTTPEDKAKQAARGKQRGVLTPVEKKKLNMEMEYDAFDVVLEYLVAEGFADTNAAALAIMANMSKEWRQDIIEEVDQIDEIDSSVIARTAHKRMQNLSTAQEKENSARDAGASMGERSKLAANAKDAAAKVSKNRALSSAHARSRKRMRDAGQK